MTAHGTGWRTALPAISWFLLIMVLLSLPGESFPTIQIRFPDKMAHIVLFGGQQLLLWIALELPLPRFRTPHRALAFSATVTLIFGVLSELYQQAFTSRMADPFDAVANAIGIGIAGFVISRWHGALLRTARKVYRIANKRGST